MIDMIKDINDACVSKMLITSFEDMLKDGSNKILEFFESTEYRPPLMTSAFIINWPENVETYTFASKTSIITPIVLETELNTDVALRTRGGFWYIFKEILCFTQF